MKPVALSPNQPADRFYRGGAKIAAFRGVPSAGARTPEDWIAAVNPLFGEESLGLTRLPTGQFLKDAIAADPRAWLGAPHVERYGADAKLLTKLLDAGERLPVHLHPTTPFAAHHLGCAHGKTEAWIMLEPGQVHLGWREPMTVEVIGGLVETQDTAAMLAAMHCLEVDAGDGVLVPAGMPHAIGAGSFLLEVQEPEDLSILLEWEGFAIDGRRDGHLGLGFDVALTATDCAPRSEAEVEGLVVRAAGAPARRSLLPDDATPFFRVDAVPVDGPQTLPAAYSVLVVVDGLVEIAGEPYPAGSVLLTPHGAGDLGLAGRGLVYRARPPA